MAYIRQFTFPLTLQDWIDSGVVVGPGDSVKITVTGEGGIGGGYQGQADDNATHYWPVYPEGVYIGQFDIQPATPFPGHAYEPENVKDFAGTQLPVHRFICSNTGPEAVVGKFVPDGQGKPPTGQNAVNDAFYIGRSVQVLGGQHIGGRLWLCFNDIDGYFGDNYGEYQVTVEIQEWELDVPEINVGMNNPKYLIFNDSIIQESSGSPRWANVRIATEISEVRRKFRSRPLWQLDLSGLLLSDVQYDELLAFQWINEGMAKEFLCRNSRQYLFENFKGEPSLIGTTDGETTLFQLRKERKIQGRVSYETIRFPKWYYPPLLDLNGRPWVLMPDTQIYVGGDGSGINRGRLISAGEGFEMDRNTGWFQLPAGLPPNLRIDAYGGYFTLMICSEDEIPVKLDGANFRISNGVKFTEPVSEDEDEEGEES